MREQEEKLAGEALTLMSNERSGHKTRRRRRGQHFSGSNSPPEIESRRLSEGTRQTLPSPKTNVEQAEGTDASETNAFTLNLYGFNVETFE